MKCQNNLTLVSNNPYLDFDIRIIGLFNWIDGFRFEVKFTAKDLLRKTLVNKTNGIVWICRCSEHWRFSTPGWLPMWYTTCNLLETHIQTKNVRVESPLSLKGQKQLWEVIFVSPEKKCDTKVPSLPFRKVCAFFILWILFYNENTTWGIMKAHTHQLCGNEEFLNHCVP